MQAEIILETEDLVFYNKPAGMLVIPDRFDEEISVLKHLAEKKHGGKLWVIHRIDRGTSGIVAFAKNEEAHKFYGEQFQDRTTEKYYECLVLGAVPNDYQLIDLPIIEHPTIKGKMHTAKKGKASQTEFWVQQQWPQYAHLRVRIHTGRMHQIRVHLAAIGHPVVCDPLYGNGQPFLLSSIKKKFNLSKETLEETPLINRPALHASKLILNDRNGDKITATAPLPKDIAATIKQLNKRYGS